MLASCVLLFPHIHSNNILIMTRALKELQNKLVNMLTRISTFFIKLIFTEKLSLSPLYFLLLTRLPQTPHHPHHNNSLHNKQSHPTPLKPNLSRSHSIHSSVPTLHRSIHAASTPPPQKKEPALIKTRRTGTINEF